MAVPAKSRAPRPKGEVPKFLAVDFFCGAGGTTRGLIGAGGYVIAGVDKESKCQQTYTENNINDTADYSPVRYLQRDIFPASNEYPDGEQEVLADELSGLIGYYQGRYKEVPLLFAICAPCQPFTTLSKKALSSDRKEGRERDSNLLREAAKFVERFKPELVLSENVAGIKDARYGGVWEDFRQTLDRLGYATGSKVVCTSKFGIPQFRKRSILVGVRRDVLVEGRCADILNTELIVPEYDPDAKTVTVAVALGHLPPIEAGELHSEIPNHRARTLSELNLKRIAAAKPGEPNSYMTKTPHGDLSLKCHRDVEARLQTRCFTDVYTRMHPGRPSPTITTKCHSISNGRFGHFDMKQNRGISLREAAILQSFPDDYIFYPLQAVDQVARMIGNAVPPKLAEFFATYAVNSVKPGSAGEHASDGAAR